MTPVLLVIHVMISIALVIVILLQRSSSDGLGGLGGGGGGNALLSGRASANLLTRTTAILATLFILNSLTLAMIASRSTDRTSLIESIEKDGDAEKADEGKPKKEDAVPSVPIAE